MTPTATIYLVLGLSILLWPLATVLTRRRILGAQWLLLAAMLMMGLTYILYSCLFNSFLRGEYLLLVLYMTFSLFTPPIAVSATALLTRPDGATRVSRAAVIPAVLTALLMLVSFFIGGADMYRLWVNRGILGESDLFFANSWRYNVIVSIHYYLYSFVLTLEVAFLALYAIVHLRRYNRILAEYYTAESHSIVRHHALYALILIVSLTIVLLTILYPLNEPRPQGFTLATSIIIGVASFVLGYALYHISYTAETLSEHLDPGAARSRHDLGQLAREISAYVESSAYTNPDLSVFLLASHFHVSQDQVVDAIHRLHGTSFADYVDTLRIEHAATLLSHAAHPDDEETLTRIAHQCGYHTPEALEAAFEKVMHTPIHKSGLL